MNLNSFAWRLAQSDTYVQKHPGRMGQTQSWSRSSLFTIFTFGHQVQYIFSFSSTSLFLEAANKLVYRLALHIAVNNRNLTS